MEYPILPLSVDAEKEPFKTYIHSDNRVLKSKKPIISRLAIAKPNSTLSKFSRLTR
ncbi:hypothetical protein GCM10023142_11510 [Anaerocolumna aminovalerica]